LVIRDILRCFDGGQVPLSTFSSRVRPANEALDTEETTIPLYRERRAGAI